MATSSIIFLLSLFGLFVLGQLQRIEIFPWPSFYVHDLLVMSWLVFISIFDRQFIITQLSFLIKKYKKYLILTVGWVLLGWIVAFAGDQFELKALAYLLRFLTYGVVFWWFSVRKLVLPKKIKLINLVLGLYLLVGGIFQYLLMPDMRFLSIFGWDDHFFRLVGTQFDPNFMGIILLLFFLQLHFQKVAKKKWLRVLAKTAVILGIALTFSRSTYATFIFINFLIAGLKIKRYWPALVLAIFIFLIPKPAGEGVVLLRTASIEARLDTSRQSLVNLQGIEWLVGKGLFITNKPSYVLDQYSRPDHASLPDNIGLLVLQSVGLLGLGSISFVLIKRLWLLSKRNQNQVLLILAVLFHSLFNNSLFQPFVFIYLALALIGEVDG